MFFRYYANQIDTLLDQGSFAANVTDILTLTQNTADADLDYAQAQAMRCVLAGKRAFLGFRLFPSSSANWFSRTHWDTKADALVRAWYRNRAIASAGTGYDAEHERRRFGFDAEGYGGAGQVDDDLLAQLGKTVDDLREAMKSFTAAIRAVGVLPCVHPASEGDHVVELIIEAANGQGELWNETSFSLLEQRLLYGPHGMSTAIRDHAAARALQLSSFPDCVIREVVSDSAMRRWGVNYDDDLSPVGNILSWLGPHRPWIFDEERDDQAYIGTSAYANGTQLSSLNDCNYVYPIGKFGEPGADFGDAFSTRYLVGWRHIIATNVETAINVSTERREGGYVIPDLSPTYLYGLRSASQSSPSDTIIPTSGSPTWTALGKFQLPSGTLGNNYILFSCVQNNAAAWQVRYDESVNKVYLDVFTTVVTSLEVMSSPARNTDIVPVVGRNGTTWRHGSSTTVVANSNLISAIGILHIGLGRIPGTTTRAGAPLLLVKESVQVWTRAISGSEYTAIQSATVPGRFPYNYSAEL